MQGLIQRLLGPLPVPIKKESENTVDDNGLRQCLIKLQSCADARTGECEMDRGLLELIAKVKISFRQPHVGLGESRGLCDRRLKFLDRIRIPCIRGLVKLLTAPEVGEPGAGFCQERTLQRRSEERRVGKECR